MFRYDFNGFARNFSVGAIGAIVETTGLIAPRIIAGWQLMTGQRALNFYRQTLTVSMAVCAVFVALGMIARKWMDAYVERCQTEGDDPATEKVERAIAKVTTAAKWVKRTITFDLFFSLAIRVILALIILGDSLGSISQRINFKRPQLTRNHA